mmetsp:Transcript_46172/g.104298  ORF Transcript_46172/g.104298 Transcript_46172/m.104298 type:complete len:161 (+) Transcript_46172:91-573(+)
MVATGCSKLLAFLNVFLALTRRDASAFSVPTVVRRLNMKVGSGDATDSSESDKELALMTAFTNRYLKVSDTYLCSEPSVAAVVIKGLAEHKATLGAPLCPCRYYEDKEAEVKVGYWNCPCVPMRERHECHCMLFLTEDNDFAGEKQEISVEEVKKHSGNM